MGQVPAPGSGSRAWSSRSGPSSTHPRSIWSPWLPRHSRPCSAYLTQVGAGLNLLGMQSECGQPSTIMHFEVRGSGS